MRFILLLFLPVFFISCWKSQNKGNSTYQEFLSELKRVAEKKDATKLALLLNDTIFESNDICGSPGCDKIQFLNSYFVSESKEHNEEQWALLNQIIELGFVKENNSSLGGLQADSLYTAPKYMNDFDWSEYLVLLKDSKIILSPNDDPRTIRVGKKGEIFHCDCCIYNRGEKSVVVDKKGNSWQEIKLDRERKGYVRTIHTSQNFYKILQIGKIHGKWKRLTWYVGEPC